jgi:hypothetical protein
LEELILSRICYSKDEVYFNDFKSNSKNPEAVIKKIRIKLKENLIEKFKIEIMYDKYN